MEPAWPDPAYLDRLGRLVYAVAALEGLILGDLARVPHAPPGLAPETLTGYTTSQLGQRIKTASEEMMDPEAKSWLAISGAALIDVAITRDHVLHARPGADADHRRLYRWHHQPGNYFFVTEEYLDGLVERVSVHRAEVERLRLPA